jgi:hypothetical protein
MAQFRRLTTRYQRNTVVCENDILTRLVIENDELRQTAADLALQNAALRERLRNETALYVMTAMGDR